MQNQFKNVYLTHPFVRLVTCTVLLSLSVLVVWGAGGIPPTSWRMLFQVLPLLPHLWLTQRTALLLPLSLLVIQALTWPILACLLLRAWLTVLYYSWSAKQRFQQITPAFSNWQRQQTPAVISTTPYADVDLHNATTDAFLLSDLSPSPSITTSGRHPAIHVPTQPDNGGTQVIAPPFPPMPEPIPPSVVSVPHLSGGIPPSPTPAQRTSPSPFWTFDSFSRP